MRIEFLDSTHGKNLSGRNIARQKLRAVRIHRGENFLRRNFHAAKILSAEENNYNYTKKI